MLTGTFSFVEGFICWFLELVWYLLAIMFLLHGAISSGALSGKTHIALFDSDGWRAGE